VLDVLLGRLRAFSAAQKASQKKNFKFLNKKNWIFFNYKFFVIKTIDMELDPLPTSLDSDPYSVNLDPKFCIILKLKSSFLYVL
jgi:hypothetical protein